MATKKRLTKAEKLALEKRAVAAERRRFNRLKPADKRVEIARDVLAQLREGKIIAETGLWVETLSVGDLTEQVCDVVSGTNCQVCGVGALFVAAVKKADKLKVNQLLEVKESIDRLEPEYGDSEDDIVHGSVVGADCYRYLKQWFSKPQLNAVEAAFEAGQGAVTENAARYFAPDVDDSSERMRLIMENIIVNKGTFKPQQQPAAKVIYVTPGFVG